LLCDSSEQETMIMKLTPHAILKLLGLNVPIEGVNVEGHDMFIYTNALKQLGATMSIDAIADTTPHKREVIELILRTDFGVQSKATA
jgi:hypothetical protein